MDAPDPRTPSLASMLPAALLILGVTAARIAYLIWLCPYALIEDEAHYWEWSRHLDWSYYSKGPGVAWTIYASTALFGVAEWSIRLPAALAMGLAAWWIARLAQRMFGDARAGFFAAALVLLVPILQMLGLLMTIDGPYLACWALACLAAHAALRNRARWAWATLGVAVGVGFLFKYTILLLLPGLALTVLALRWRSVSGLRLAPRWPAWAAIGTLAGAAATTPVWIFNAREGWPTVRHLLGHVNAPGGDTTAATAWSYDPGWTLEFVGVQIALVGPALFLMAYCAWTLYRRPRTSGDRAAAAFAAAVALPVLAFYLLLTLITRVEGNWPVAGYVSLLALAGGGVRLAFEERRVQRAEWKSFGDDGRPPLRARIWPWARKPNLHRVEAFKLAIAFGLLAGLLGPRLDLLKPIPVLGSSYTLPWDEQQTVRRPIVPVQRLMGIRDVAARVDGLRTALRDRTAKEPFVIAQHYGRASLLAFYLEGRPTTYCSSALMGGRRTQYDHIPETDLLDPGTHSRLLGRPAIALGATHEQWMHGFPVVERLGVLQGETKPDRESFRALRYRGFPEARRALEESDTAGGEP
ncbi:MAG: glycosyltransferase family 39 protein [Planctomycetota bacterium]